MIKIIGRFYFELDANNDLNGKFSNNLHFVNYSETARRNSDASPTFIGQFESTWIDELGLGSANLTIEFKNGSSEILSLKWLDKDNVFLFEGEGFIINNILLGDYRNFNL